MKLWIKNPLAVYGAESPATSGILVEDGKIAAILDTPPLSYDDSFDASDLVLLPGLINGHHHFYQTLTRAVPAAGDRGLFPWLEALYPVWANLTPEDVFVSTQLAAAELLLSGCTTAVDHHYLFSEQLDNATEIQIEALSELGLRHILCRGSMSLGASEGGLPPDRVTQSEHDILNHSEQMLERFHDPSPHAMTQIAIAPCSPFSVSKELMRQSAVLAKSYSAGLHTHLAETHDETQFCLDLYGQRPLDYLEELDWLGHSTWLAHGIHFESSELDRLGQSETSVVHCPSSNMILGSGTCLTLDLMNSGVNVGIGVDGSASNDHSNLIQETRQAFLLQRLYYGSDRVKVNHALDWATSDGALSLNRPELGQLKVGYAADLAFFRVSDIQHSGHHDPITTLILSGAHQAFHVMVAGKWCVIQGELANVDAEALKAKHQSAARALLSRL